MKPLSPVFRPECRARRGATVLALILASAAAPSTFAQSGAAPSAEPAPRAAPALVPGALPGSGEGVKPAPPPAAPRETVPPAGTGPAAPKGPIGAAPGSRPRIGLALSGGGARGFAHVGVLRALEQLRVPVDCVAGTSAGSAVAAAYATGHSPDEIEASLRSVDWNADMFDDEPPRRDQQPRRKNEEKAYLLDLTFGYRDGSVLVPPGLISGQKIELFLHRMLGTSGRFASFDELAIPFRAIATDLERGEMVVQDRGSLVTAVRASMAVPSAFAPVQSEGRLLVDGGLTRNFPVDIVREMCADVVIAVDIGSGLLKREELGSVFGVAGQMINILMERNMRESREQVRPDKDVLIVPELGEIARRASRVASRAFRRARKATLAVREALERLALPPDAYASWHAQRASRVVRDDSYVGVRVVGAPPATARAMLTQAGIEESGTLDRDRLERTINSWNSSGDYDRISYSLLPDAGGQVLEIQPIEKSWGPNFLRFGLGASADSQNNGVFNVLLGYRRPQINQYGGEVKASLQFGSTVRALAELWQPLNAGRARAFLNPQFVAEEVPVWIFRGKDRVAEYGVRTSQIGLDVGVQGVYGEARLGAFGGERRTFVRTGSVGLPADDEQFYGAHLSLIADQLDATDFPRDGFLLGATVRTEDVQDGRGGSYLAKRGLAFGKSVYSWKDHTVAGAFRIGEASDRISLNQAFSLGGFMNLSGLQLNQVLGTSLRYASLSYQNQIMQLAHPLGRGVYAGLALEGGRMSDALLDAPRDWLYGATAFLGAATGIGPLYLGYGTASGGNRLVYIFLGRPGL